MSHRLLVFAMAGILIVSATAACAQTQGRHPYFDRMDVNKDGFLTKEEVQKQFPKFTDEMFKQADTSHDGKLTVQEWQTFAKARRAERKGGDGTM